MIGALAKGMEAGAWAFGAVLIFAVGALLVLLGVAGLAWMFGDGEEEKGDELPQSAVLTAPSEREPGEAGRKSEHYFGGCHGDRDL